MSFSRRDFIATTAMGTIALGVDAQTTKKTDGKSAEVKMEAVPSGGKNVIVTKRTGIKTIEKAYEFLVNGGDTLDAAIMVGKAQEDDPNDDTVGLGGLPNEDGVVELDSCCMHGPTRRAGAVGAVRNIKNVSLLAKAVMENTGHVMLVGEGAERFAKAMGFPQENLLTEAAHKTWLLWKKNNSNQDWWGPGLADPKYEVPEGTVAPKLSETYEERWRQLEEEAARIGIPSGGREHAIERVLRPPTGTIHVSVLNAKGEMSGMTTTSGLAWKLAGRCGDSPIIGAGCFTDQDVGSAGATGSGEENLKVAGAHSIVENMRKGMSPREAGMDVLKRIVRAYEKTPAKLRYISMVYYILRKDGEYAGVTLWSGPKEKPYTFAVHDGKARLEQCVALFQGESLDFPPAPQAKQFR
ncbi:MAG TPA: N(4)-(beta-N-acetylglucosaminyl)-L-asparaginase [Terriglobales bacterium]|nr:N(4)-(beta-N-acetylglucosaminyl)-L-asparaginase [Terriglobales bacterium]